jgi:rod shape-determining protein MreD
MRWLRLGLLTAAAALLAVRWPAGYAASGFAACWLLLPALLVGLHATPGRAVVLAWGLGLLADLLSLEPLGVRAAFFGAAALLVARVREHLFAEHFLTQAVIAATLALAVNLLVLLRIEIVEPDLAFFAAFPRLLLLSLMTGAAFPILVAVDRRTGLLDGFRARERRV